MYGEFNSDTLKFDGDIKAIQSTFSKSQVFQTLETALDFAEQEAYNYEYLEDGIAIIPDFKDYGYLFENGEKSEKD